MRDEHLHNCNSFPTTIIINIESIFSYTIVLSKRNCNIFRMIHVKRI